MECQFGKGTLPVRRLRHNMLSSMPLCFNIFGALQYTPALVELIRLADPEAARVDRITCESTPTSSLGDRTAFDAFVEYRSANGHRRFLGVETKYTEPFSQSLYPKRNDTYRLTTETGGWFRSGSAEQLNHKSNHQLWRNVMLASLVERDLRFEHGRVLVLTTDDDAVAKDVVDVVSGHLIDSNYRLKHETFEQLVDTARASSDPSLRKWGADFDRRYLDLATPGISDASNARSSIKQPDTTCDRIASEIPSAGTALQLAPSAADGVHVLEQVRNR